MSDLTQSEADHLFKMEKRRVDETVHRLSSLRLEIPLQSEDGREMFHLDIGHGRINLLKSKHQTRAKQTVVLARVDVGGAIHRNPDGEEIQSPHLHLFREGYGAKWAFPLPINQFRNPHDPEALLADFLSFCNVIAPPHFDRELFT